VDGPAAAIDITATRAAVRRAAGEFGALLGHASDADVHRAVRDSDWDLGDVAAHVAVATEVYTNYAHGETEAFVDVSDIAGGSLARTSAARLRAEPERELTGLARRVHDASSALLDATDGRDASDPVVWNGQATTVGTMLGIILAEYLLHGRDLAETLGRPWTIGADDARLVLAAVLPMLPLLVDPATTARVQASFDLRVRGATRVTLVVDHGSLSVEGPGAAVDCHVSAEPVALLLVAYGRRTQWVPIATGKLVAWGRKPWLGTRLTSYLVTP
jgi:uncharacterized protein (TIGR03083 family)